jgi:hypothetical protein
MCILGNENLSEDNSAPQADLTAMLIFDGEGDCVKIRCSTFATTCLV